MHYRHRGGDHLRILQSVAGNRAGDGRGTVAAVRARARRQGAAPASPLVGAGGHAAAGRGERLCAVGVSGARQARDPRLGAARPGSGDRTCAARALGHGPVAVLGGAVVAAAAADAHRLRHFPRRVRRRGDRRHREPRAGRGGRFRGGDAVRPAGRARGGAARLAARLPLRVLPGAAGVRHAAVRRQGTVGAALSAGPGAGAREPVHRTGGAADRRRPHVPRRGAAAVLRCDAGGRRAARVPRPVPAARGAGGVAPRRQPRRPGAAGAGARAVPPCAGGLSHCGVVAARGHVRFAPEGARFRGSDPARPGARRAHARPPRLLPPYRDSLGAPHAGVGGEHRRRDRHGGVDRHRLTPARQLLRPAVVDLRPARQRAAHAARLARGDRAGQCLCAAQHAAAGTSRARGRGTRGTGAGARRDRELRCHAGERRADRR